MIYLAWIGIVFRCWKNIVWHLLIELAILIIAIVFLAFLDYNWILCFWSLKTYLVLYCSNVPVTNDEPGSARRVAIIFHRNFWIRPSNFSAFTEGVAVKKITDINHRFSNIFVLFIIKNFLNQPHFSIIPKKSTRKF